MSAARLTRPADAPTPDVGMVHLGLGAFFRAHGAIYVAEAMAASGGDWGVTGVSLRRPDQRDLLAPQGCAYHAVELGPDGATAQLVTVVQNVLVASEDPDAVVAAMAVAKIVSLTITEKGYCHSPASGRLDFDHPDIVADLGNADKPVSAIGFICRALDRIRVSGGAPFTVLCCDNIPNNGALVRGVVVEFAGKISPELAVWIEANVTFPSTMVDRIVPATTAADVALVEDLTGFHDAAPVMHEPFRQWVIEDNFVGNKRPDFAAVGAEMVSDVTQYEHMKLRCLNGTHSATAYLGYLAGAETVAEAVARPVVANYLKHLWTTEIIPVLDAPPGADLPAYANALLRRYQNPGIRHLTWQIAMDGSQKLPQRILGTIAENLDAGRVPKGLLLAVAGWMRYTSGRDETGSEIDVRDPMAKQLAACWSPGAPASEVVNNYLKLDRIFPAALAREARFRLGVEDALSCLREQGAANSMAAIAD